MDKKKFSVEIAGNHITLVTDEPEDFVKLITDTVGDRISEMTKSSFRVSNLDAAILLAVDYLGDKLKAERKVRALESRLELYELKLQSLSAEKPEEIAEISTENPPETIGNTIKDSAEGAESKIRALEKYLDSKKSETASPKSREEKIKYIESLLRGNN